MPTFATPSDDSGAPWHRYRQLLDRVPAIVYVAEPGELGRWLFVGEQIRAILGYTAKEWSDNPELWAARLHPDDRETALKRELDMEESGGGTFTDEYRMVHRDGTVVWLRDHAYLVAEPAGSLLWHGVMTDVTRYKTLETRLQRQGDRHAAVAALGERALEGAVPEALISAAAASATSLLEVDAAVMAELVDSGSKLQVRFSRGASAVSREPQAVDPRSHSGAALITRAPVVVSDWGSETRFERPPGLGGWLSGICVPVEGARGAFGVFSVGCREPREFVADEVSFLQSLANVLADAFDRRAIEDEIRHSALHDPLTGLPNRLLLVDRVEHALAAVDRHGGMVALLFVDLDHFKLINDSFGHPVGDELLAAVAPMLRQVVRSSDTVARMGGDEFAVLLERVQDHQEAVAMAERIGALFNRPFAVGGGEHFVTASIGIALSSGADSPTGLIRSADAAMYKAKDGGRARAELFDDEMRERALARLLLENELRRALERDQCEMHYQPIVALSDGSLVAVEALLRWNSPSRGNVSPREFIPLAEQNGLIDPIGRWALEQACSEAAKWIAQLRPGFVFSVSVNLSPAQLANPMLLETVRHALARSGLDAARLCLEITETAMLRDPAAVSSTLAELSELGVRLALDDFGTGYSSLSHLAQLRLDTVKIDRAFVRQLTVGSREYAIVEAIASMARALSLNVVAEGVEHREQASVLRRLGCQQAQGSLYSPPVPASVVSEMLRQR